MLTFPLLHSNNSKPVDRNFVFEYISIVFLKKYDSEYCMIVNVFPSNFKSCVYFYLNLLAVKVCI